MLYVTLRVLSLILFAAFILYMFRRTFARNMHSFRHFLLWLLVFAVLIIIYAFRFELTSFKDRILAVVIPSYSWTNEEGELVIARSRDGHFYLDVTAHNNIKIHFLIDTGATGVSLSPRDAKKLGFNLDKLVYDQKHSTANGISYSAAVRIPKLIIGKKTLHNVRASVSSGGLDTSLLGMSVIDDFSDFKISRDLLILKY